MRRQQQLLIKLKRQRDLLNELIERVGDTHELGGVSSTYDTTTKQIERNLQDLRRFLITTK